MRYKDIIKEHDKEKLRELLFKNIDISNFESFLYFLKNNDYELYNFFLDIKNNFIDLLIDKEPLIIKISDDKIINITGESGSGKSTYVKEHFNNDDYEIIETDVLFNEKYNDNLLINKIRKDIFNKYSDEHFPGGYNLQINFNHFNECLKIILDNTKNIDKTLVIDSGQFRHLKNYNLLKGQIIIIRTSINESLNRACARFLKTHNNPTEEAILMHKMKKYTSFETHKKFNTLIIKLFILYKF